MGRRRQRRKVGRARHRSHWLGRLLGIGIFAVALLAVGGYLALRAYLHSDEFRMFLAGKAGEALKTDAEFAPFHWDGLQVSSAKFEAHGGPYFTRLRADQLSTEIGLGEVRKGTWILHSTSIRRLAVDIPGALESAPPRSNTNIAAPPAPAPRAPKSRGWFPESVRIENLRIDESIITGHVGKHPFAARGQSWTVKPGDRKGAFELKASGGTLEHSLRWFPDACLDHARFRIQAPRLYLIDSEFKVYRNALLDLSGEAAFDTGEFTFEGGTAGIDCNEILSEDWSKRLLGKIGVRFAVRRKDGETTVTGKLGIRDGVLTALPVLDRLAAYADTTRFRTLALNRARTDFSWRKDRLSLSNIVISSEGLMRLEGNLVITGEQLDGHFQLGLPPGTLARIPGAESVVFAERREGLMWTPLRITGTLEHPEEDLSARLLQAAGERMFEILPETGAKVIKFTRTAIGEVPGQAIESGTRALETGVETGVDAIRGATGIARDIGGLFGLLPGRKPAPPPENENRTGSGQN